jgi:hypothetical protein
MSRLKLVDKALELPFGLGRAHSQQRFKQLPPRQGQPLSAVLPVHFKAVVVSGQNRRGNGSLMFSHLFPIGYFAAPATPQNPAPASAKNCLIQPFLCEILKAMKREVCVPAGPAGGIGQTKLGTRRPSPIASAAKCGQVRLSAGKILKNKKFGAFLHGCARLPRKLSAANPHSTRMRVNHFCTAFTHLCPAFPTIKITFLQIMHSCGHQSRVFLSHPPRLQELPKKSAIKMARNFSLKPYISKRCNYATM